MFNIFRKASKGKVTIAEILKGCTPGRMQSVCYMQVIPLTSNICADNISAPDQLKVSTRSYGCMAFENDTDNICIVPAHAGYVVKQHAQDHAMAHAGLVGKKFSRQFSTAMCIQQSQGGFINKDKHRMIVLPFSLRETAYSSRKVNSYQKLWEPIAQFNSRLGVNAHGHLEYFLNHFKTELDQFVAEFEPVENQVGAIILIDGEVVGIERAPNYDYWLSVWPSLIRECYGSLAIEYRKKIGDKVTEPKVHFPLQGEIANLEELKRALEEARQREEEFAKAAIRSLLQDEFSCEKEEQLEDLVLQTVQNEQFLGQIVQEKPDASDSQVVYASLVLRKEWEKYHARQKASPFTI